MIKFRSFVVVDETNEKLMQIHGMNEFIKHRKMHTNTHTHTHESYSLNTTTESYHSKFTAVAAHTPLTIM